MEEPTGASGSPTGSSSETREAGTEAGARVALTLLGGRGGAAGPAVGGGAGEGQGGRPVRLYWELLAELAQESRRALRSSSVCLKDLTMGPTNPDQRCPRGPPSPPPAWRSWKGGRGYRRSRNGAKLVQSGADSPVQVSAPLENSESLKDKQVPQNLLMVPEPDAGSASCHKRCVCVCLWLCVWAGGVASVQLTHARFATALNNILSSVESRKGLWETYSQPAHLFLYGVSAHTNQQRWRWRGRWRAATAARSGRGQLWTRKIPVRARKPDRCRSSLEFWEFNRSGLGPERRSPMPRPPERRSPMLPAGGANVDGTFLHSVLAVGVQFLTATSSGPHLRRRRRKQPFSQSDAVVGHLTVPLAHLEHFLHSSHAWSGLQNRPGPQRHTVLRVWVQGVTTSWSEETRALVSGSGGGEARQRPLVKGYLSGRGCSGSTASGRWCAP